MNQNEHERAATRETRGTPPTECNHERTEYWLGNTYCLLCRKWLYAGYDAPLRIKTCPKCGASISWILECDNGHEFQGPDYATARVSQPVAPPPPLSREEIAKEQFSATWDRVKNIFREPATEPVAPGASALAESCEIIIDLLEKLDYEGITESESDSIVRAKEFVRAAAPAGTQPAQEEK